MFHLGCSETGHITHTVTPACLLFLSIAFVAFRTVLLALSREERKKERKKEKEKKVNKKTYNIKPLFQFLLWLPTPQRVQYKINTLCYKCITFIALSSVCDCLQLYTLSRTLLSAFNTLNLQITHTRLTTVGSRAFSVFGPSLWNDLLLPVRKKHSLDGFKSNLKTFLFPKQKTCHVLRSALLSSSASSLCCPRV